MQVIEEKSINNIKSLRNKRPSKKRSFAIQSFPNDGGSVRFILKPQSMSESSKMKLNYSRRCAIIKKKRKGIYYGKHGIVVSNAPNDGGSRFTYL